MGLERRQSGLYHVVLEGGKTQGPLQPSLVDECNTLETPVCQLVALGSALADNNEQHNWALGKQTRIIEA